MGQPMHDPEVMREIVRLRLLRAIASAAGRLAGAARGRTSMKESEERACIALARLAPAMLSKRCVEGKGDVFDAPEWWTPEQRFLSEKLGPYDSEREAVSEWIRVFELHGAYEGKEGKFTTRPEAAEFGRERFRKQQSGEIQSYK